MSSEFDAPVMGSRQNIAISFSTEKLDCEKSLRTCLSVSAHQRFYGDALYKSTFYLFTYFDRIPACDRQSDRHTDVLRQHRPRYAQHRAVKSCAQNWRGSRRFLFNAVAIKSNQSSSANNSSAVFINPFDLITIIQNESYNVVAPCPISFIPSIHQNQT